MPEEKPRPADGPVRDDVVEARRIARLARRRDRSREEILMATRKVLLRSGVGGTTLEAVAAEAGMSKAALYYYFSSKDALLFELILAIMETRARDVHGAVSETTDGAGALHALIGGLVRGYAQRLDDFRLAFLHGQLAPPGSVHLDAGQFARIRPLNDLLLADATEKLTAGGDNRAGVEPRLLAFLAHLAAIGVLTMKGVVESVDDPLLYSDDQLIEGLARVFAVAAEPAGVPEG